jgi:hypothetical protein
MLIQNEVSALMEFPVYESKTDIKQIYNITLDNDEC